MFTLAVDPHVLAVSYDARGIRLALELEYLDLWLFCRLYHFVVQLKLDLRRKGTTFFRNSQNFQQLFCTLTHI